MYIYTYVYVHACTYAHTQSHTKPYTYIYIYKHVNNKYLYKDPKEYSSHFIYEKPRHSPVEVPLPSRPLAHAWVK